MLHTMLASETEKGLRSVSLQPQISWASGRGGFKTVTGNEASNEASKRLIFIWYLILFQRKAGGLCSCQVR